MTWPWTSAGPMACAAVGYGFLSCAAWQATGSVPSISAKWKLGKFAMRREMLPPGVFTSTGVEMAYSLSSTTIDDGQLPVRGGVDGLPELALAGGAFADGDVDHLVAVEVQRP